jgi:hypothetical protein
VSSAVLLEVGLWREFCLPGVVDDFIYHLIRNERINENDTIVPNSQFFL